MAEEITDHEVHVYPTEDLVMHNLWGQKCQCSPKILRETKKGKVITHNSWDLREQSEIEDSFLHRFAQQPHPYV